MRRLRAWSLVLASIGVAQAEKPAPFSSAVLNAYSVLQVKCVAARPDGKVELEILRSIAGAKKGRLILGRTGFKVGGEYLVALDQDGQLVGRGGSPCGTIAQLAVDGGRAILCPGEPPRPIDELAAAIAEARADRRVDVCRR